MTSTLSKLIFLGSIFFLVGCTSTDQRELPTVHVAIASNLQIVFDSIATIGLEEGLFELELSSGASGMLTNQILSGAPYDVFYSANKIYPTALMGQNMIDSHIELYRASVELAYRSDSTFNTPNQLLLSKDIKLIALANVETAPYGIAAIELTKSLGINDSIEQKYVYGESLGHVCQYLLSGAVEAGFTSNSFREKYQREFKFVDLDTNFYEPIIISQSVLKGKEGESVILVDFMRSKRAISIFEHFGYLSL